jgi:predicted branched-subunit amino acid permease
VPGMRGESMHLPKRDIIATGLVIAAAIFYLLWDAGSALPGLSGTRATGMVVLALGFAASATAVVPAFDQLLHGSKTYLAVTSLLGVVAVISGAQMLVAASATGLAIVMIAMVGLWLIATIHHSLLNTNASPTAGRHAVKPASRPTGVH